MKRNHPLYVGEVVFDVNKNYFGVITELTDKKVVIDMNGSSKDVRDGWCEDENRKMFDCEITDNELVWETDDLDSLYQVAWHVKDNRVGEIVCYEHNNISGDYPYYSPYLEENLYNFEVE